jgi:hypothetical protein
MALPLLQGASPAAAIWPLCFPRYCRRVTRPWITALAEVRTGLLSLTEAKGYVERLSSKLATRARFPRWLDWVGFAPEARRSSGVLGGLGDRCC